MKKREELSLEEWVDAYNRSPSGDLTRKGSDYVGPCPVCGGDDRFSIKRKDTGGVLINCRHCAGNKPKGDVLRDVVEILFGSPKEGEEEPQAAYNPEPRKKRELIESDYGCTLNQFIERLAVPISASSYKITETTCPISGVGEDKEKRIIVPAVRFPFLTEDGKSETGAMLRVRLSGEDKMRYETGSKAMAYGLQSIALAREFRKIVIVEGQSDWLTLDEHEIPALGMPGAGTLKVLLPEYFEGIDEVFVVQEHGEAGQKLPFNVGVHLKDHGVNAVVKILRLPTDDVNDLYKDNPKSFLNRFGRAVKEARGLRKSKIVLKFARDILARDYPPMRWAIPGLLPEGLVTVFASPKVGKSFWALQAAVAVAQGKMFCGKKCWTAEEGEVWIIDLEQWEGTQMQGRFRHMGVDRKSFNTIVTDEFPRLDAGGLEELDIFLEEHPRCRLVIIDVWTNVEPSQRFEGMNAYQSEYRWCEKIRSIFLRRRCCCLVIHHDRKSDSDGGITDKVTGSKALPAASNAVLWLKRPIGETKGTLSITGRDGVMDAVINGKMVDRVWTFEPPDQPEPKQGDLGWPE